MVMGYLGFDEGGEGRRRSGKAGMTGETETKK
jgi:hypothetical protein